MYFSFLFPLVAWHDVQCAVLVPATGTIGHVKSELAKATGVSVQHMVVGDVWGHRVYRELEDDDGVSAMTQRDITVFLALFP